MNKFLNTIIENNKDYLEDIATKIKEVMLEFNKKETTYEEFESALEKKGLAGYLDVDNNTVDILIPKFNNDINEQHLYSFVSYELDFKRKLAEILVIELQLGIYRINLQKEKSFLFCLVVNEDSDLVECKNDMLFSHLENEIIFSESFDLLTNEKLKDLYKFNIILQPLAKEFPEEIANYIFNNVEITEDLKDLLLLQSDKTIVFDFKNPILNKFRVNVNTLKLNELKDLKPKRQIM